MMIAYVDSSVVLRIVLQQANALREWREITTGVASALLEVECLRTLERRQQAGDLSAKAVAVRRDTVYRLLETFHVIEPSPAILRRAALPVPTPLGTLDAIHLATAGFWRDEFGEELTVATHDQALAAAARATGFHTIGL